MTKKIKVLRICIFFIVIALFISSAQNAEAVECDTTPGINFMKGCFFDGTAFNTYNGSINVNQPALSSPVPDNGSPIPFTNWDYSGPDPFNVETFSMVWRGTFNFNAGNYIFTAKSDDGQRVYLDGIMIIDDWVNQDWNPPAVSSPISISAGNHTLMMEYYENGSRSVYNLSWVKQFSPSPTVSLTVDNTNINYNDSTIVRWTSNYATTCSGNGGTNGWAGNRNTSGSFTTGALTNTTTYSITCNNNSGSVSSSVTVQVNNQNNFQASVNISADRTNVSFNESTIIRWYPNNANSCYGSNGSNGWAGNKNTSVNSFYTGPLTQTTTYTISCNGSNGSYDSRSVTVYVSNQQINNQPYVTTNNATNITNSGAILNGIINGNGLFTTAWFEYGVNMNLGYTTSHNSYGSGFANYNASIAGLNPNTIYYFRAVAQSPQGIVYGNILSFNTTQTFVINNQPTVVISADDTNLAYNGTTFIRWYTANATSCVASGGSVSWAGGKSIGPASFYTGSLNQSRTYTIVCSNNFGSSSDSVTITVRPQVVITTVSRPAPTSLVLITSSVDRNQPIVPTIDNTRPHPGDQINYTVSYQNIGTGAITNLNLRIILPLEVDYMFSNPANPTILGNTLVFNLGTLRANGEGAVTIRVRVREDIPAGTNLNFPAILSYIDPSGLSQSVTVNVSAQVWSEPEPIVAITTDDVSLAANVLGAGVSFPNNIFSWLILIILILLAVLLTKYIFNKKLVPSTTTTTTATITH